MPGYIKKALTELKHSTPAKRQDSPYPHTPPKYGAKKHYADVPIDSPPLDKEGKRYIQRANGKFLYYARGVDPTMLMPLSALASQQANPTEDTLKKAKQFLDYAASQEEAIITYSASQMILAAHSDAGYLNEPEARSRAGGHFFLSSDVDIPPNNGAILTVAQVIKNVMSSAAEAELGALYIIAREAAHARTILEALGHKQPPTPIQTENSTADGIINNRILPKQLKLMDMRFHWLRDRMLQKFFRFYWRPGTLNWANYFTKHHPAAHHCNVGQEYIIPQSVLLKLRAGN